MEYYPIRLEGEGGKSARAPKEAPDSLFSNNIARIVDLLSEGEIEGLVDGLKSVYYNEVALQAPDNSFNFTGAAVTANYGSADQNALAGFPNVKTTVSVGQDLPFNVNKTISFPNDGTVTQVVVTIAAASFFEVDEDGDTNGTSVSFVIEVSEDGGTFQQAFNGTISGKQTDEVTFDFPVTILEPTGNTAIRVRRTTSENTSLRVNDDITFRNYTQVIEHKFNYPNLAYVGHVVDAKQYGDRLPTRQYHARGIKCRVPHNYDPVTRTYTGPFNGTLTADKHYTNCGPWILHEIVTNKRFGLGRFFDASYVDIPSLYQLGQWADGYRARGTEGQDGLTDDFDASTGAHGVPDGRGGFEPRWTTNAYVKDRGAAFNFLKELVSSFRGNLFWMQAKLWAIGDQRRDPVKIVNNSNVEGGIFTYSGESNRSRYSVVNVAFNDPDLFFRRGIATHEDPELIRELGYKPKDFGAFGCTSRSQAIRLAKALLFTQEYESEIVSYTASFDHMQVYGDGPDGMSPGDIILIADRERGNAVAGGRVKAIAGNAVTLDRDTGAVANTVGTLYVEHADGEVEWINCTYNADGVLFTAVPVQPVATNDLFILIDGGFDAEPFIVLKIKEDGPNKVEVTAVKYNEQRYAEIYGDQTIDEQRYMTLDDPEQVQVPALPVTFEESYVTNVEDYNRTLDVEWGRSADPFLSHYRLRWSRQFGEWETMDRLPGPTAKLRNVKAGTYRVQIVAVNRLGIESQPLYDEHVVAGVPDTVTLPIGDVSNPTTPDGGNMFEGGPVRIDFDVTNPLGSFLEDGIGIVDPNILLDPTFRDILVTVRDPSDSSILRQTAVIDRFFEYSFEDNLADTNGTPLRTLDIEIQYRDRFGRIGSTSTTTVTNPAPVFVTQPTLTPAYDGFDVATERPVDPDFAGIKVYASLTSPVQLIAGNLKYEGPNTSTYIPQIADGEHYVVVVPYDVFGDGTPSTQAPVTPDPVSTSIIGIQTDVSDLITTYGTTASAAVSAAEAAADASAAETARLAAEEAEETAGSSAASAASSASNASTDAASAASSSLLAANHAADADNSAAASLASQSAAVVSASSAATSESNAASSAATATTQAGVASTQAGIATTQATSAGSDAAAASASEILAAQYRDDNRLETALQLPSTFDDEGVFWQVGNNFFTGVPYHRATAETTNDADNTYPSISGEGKVLQRVNSSGVFVDVTSQGTFIPISGRRYRFSARFRQTTGAPGTATLFGITLNSTYGYNAVGTGSTTSSTLTLNTWSELEIDRTGDNMLNGGTVYARPMLRCNQPNATYQVAMLSVEDVTSEHEAVTSAAASLTSEANALASEGGAATSASNAAASTATAITQAGVATTQAGIATTQATLATAEAAAAATSATLSASLSAGYLSMNAHFTTGVLGGTPAAGDQGWQNWTGALANKTYIAGEGQNPFAMQQVADAGSNGGIFLNGLVDNDRAPVSDDTWYVIEADVELVAGTWRGAGVYFNNRSALGSAGTYELSFTGEDVEGVQQGDGTVGDRRHYAIMFKTNSNNSITSLFYAMNHWTEFASGTLNNGTSNGGDISAANTIIWHKVGYRLATQAEVEQSIVLPQVQADITNESAVRASEDAALATDITNITTTVNGNTASISTVQSTVNGISARYGVTLDVNGYITGFQLLNGTGGTEFKVKADNFKIETSSGDKTPFSVTADRIEFGADLYAGSYELIFDNGSIMLVQGVGFGANSDLIEWFGPSQAVSLCTKANATSYKATDGSAYFGGSLLAGTLTNGATSSSTSNTSEIVVGPFGTNGNYKLVTVGYNLFTSQVINWPGTCPSSPVTPSVTITLERSFNGSSWTTLVGGNTSTGSYDCNAPLGPGEPGSHTENIGGGFTFTDTNTSTADFYYRARITSRTLNTIPGTQKLSVISVEE